jgi:hypothetical protein
MIALAATIMPRDTTTAIISVSINIPCAPATLLSAKAKHIGTEGVGILAGSPARFNTAANKLRLFSASDCLLLRRHVDMLRTLRLRMAKMVIVR